jgi:hypothetical protein
MLPAIRLGTKSLETHSPTLVTDRSQPAWLRHHRVPQGYLGYVARLPVESSVDRLLAVSVAFWRSMDSYRTGGPRHCPGDGWT